MISTRLKQIAHHEAAHAVTAFALCGGVDKISIIPNHGFGGICSTDFGDTANQAENELWWFTVNIIVFYAGFEGSVKAGYSGSWEEDAQDDYEKAADLLFRTAGANQEYFDELQKSTTHAAKTLVHSCWPQIVKLAIVLVKERELEGGAVVRLLDIPMLKDAGTKLPILQDALV